MAEILSAPPLAQAAGLCDVYWHEYVLLIASGAAAAWWLHEPLATGAEPLELAIEPGTTPRGVARDVVAAGAQPLRNCSTPRLAWPRPPDQGGRLAIPAGTTPRSLLRMLVRGEEALRATDPQWRAGQVPAGAPGAGQGRSRSNKTRRS